jgi:hypothetical protein
MSPRSRKTHDAQKKRCVPSTSLPHLLAVQLLISSFKFPRRAAKIAAAARKDERERKRLRYGVSLEPSVAFRVHLQFPSDHLCFAT